MPTNDYWNHTQQTDTQPAGQQPQPTQQLAGQPAQPCQQDQAAQPQPQPQPWPQPQATQPQQPQGQPVQQSSAQPAFQSQQRYYYAPQPASVMPQPQYQPPQQPQGKSHKWIIAVVVIVCLFAFTAFCVHTCTTSIASIGSTTSSLDNLSGDTIAVIDIDGTIQYDGSACSPEGLKELLDEAEDNANIKAVVLRVNSGGGTATAGEEMAEYVRQFAKVKPIVVSSASINASAAYEISSQANYIFVAKSTEIGAIGTAMQLTDISGLLDMLGVNMEVITSADEKDSSYGFRPLTEEERAEYQRMVDQINDVFIQNVADGRRMSVDEVRKLATGMPFTGIDAVKNGLADAVGTREDALDKAAELAGISDYSTTDLRFRDYDLSSLSYLLGKSDASVEDLVDLLKEENARVKFK